MSEKLNGVKVWTDWASDRGVIAFRSNGVLHVHMFVGVYKASAMVRDIEADGYDVIEMSKSDARQWAQIAKVEGKVFDH